jgi:formylmethanofuran dehydrogenase subunit E
VKLEMAAKKQSFDSIVRKATKFHGHLGPLLVVGVRMGLIGLRELKTNGSNFDIQAIAILKQTPPFSCAIDGIQVVTHCTVGNGKLMLKDKTDIISAIFKTSDGRQVTISLKSTKYEELRKGLAEDRESCKNIQLAKEIAYSPEEELFIIEK